MSQDCESYFGDCCGNDCESPVGAIDHFHLVISAFDQYAYPYLAWSSLAGGTLVVRSNDDDPPGRGPLKPGRWSWRLTISGATIDSAFDDVWFTSTDEPSTYVGQTIYFNTGHVASTLTGNMIMNGQFVIPCIGRRPGADDVVPVYALLYFQRLHSGPPPAGFKLDVVGTWLSDPP